MRRSLAALALVLGAISVPALAQDATAPAGSPTQPEFDPSKPVIGMGFSRTYTGLMVRQVLPGSAAAKANFKEGEIITRVNGVQLKGMELEIAIQILNAIDGELVFEVPGRGEVRLRKAPVPNATGE